MTTKIVLACILALTLILCVCAKPKPAPQNNPGPAPDPNGPGPENVDSPSPMVTAPAPKPKPPPPTPEPPATPTTKNSTGNPTGPAPKRNGFTLDRTSFFIFSFVSHPISSIFGMSRLSMPSIYFIRCRSYVFLFLFETILETI
jgi:hypothetical protein